MKKPTIKSYLREILQNRLAEMQDTAKEIRKYNPKAMTHIPHNLEQAHKLLTGHGIKPSWLKLVSSKGDHYYGLSYYASANGKDEHLAFARALLAGMGLTVFYSHETITIKI